MKGPEQLKAFQQLELYAPQSYRAMDDVTAKSDRNGGPRCRANSLGHNCGGRHPLPVIEFHANNRNYNDFYENHIHNTGTQRLLHDKHSNNLNELHNRYV